MLLAYTLCLAVLAVYGAHAAWLGVWAWKLPARGPAPEPWPEAAWPDVTVQLPLYNEAHVAERLIEACAALDYPRDRLFVQVLDDSSDETGRLVARTLARLRARGLRAEHRRRHVRDGFKAGALQAGLATARGEFLAIFDADFVPPPDFLRRVIPRFDADDGGTQRVGCVQARWAHLNAGHSLLTRLQAFGLDAHFAAEQRVRAGLGLFFGFNGTAGVWRRACIDAAGGWHADTLAEDLDLSVRAQLAGWRLVYADDVAAPAELPVELAGLRAQQRRWTMGGVAVARKLLGRLLRAPLPLRVRVAGALHLTAHVAIPFGLAVALLHAPLALSGAAVPAGTQALGLVGAGGYALFFAAAQRHRTGQAWRGLAGMPLFVAGMIGLSVSNTWAVAMGLAGSGAPFERTAKYGAPESAGAGSNAAGSGGRWRASRYRARRLPPVALVEMAALAYAAAGAVALVAAGRWSALPFQVLVVAGFALAFGYGVLQVRGAAGPAREAAGAGRTLAASDRSPAWTAPA